MAPFGKGVFLHMQHRLATLPEALARVCRFALETPELVVRMSLADLARQSGSGEASVIRFCRALGFEGFREFRVALAADIAYQQGNPPKPSSDLAERLCAALRSTSEHAAPETLRRTAALLLAAPHVDVFGAGLSGMLAGMVAYRLARIGLLARAFSDPVVSDEVTLSRHRGSVALLVTETGLTLRNEQFLSLARDRGARTVAITGHAQKELQALCDEVLVASPLMPLPERGELGPVIAKLFLCDLLVQEVVHLRSSGAGL
ncbi:MurR/RpiR family transcriptional regulator [Paenirhodobacter hankyongi]|nr:MurR/RpiR family transcriptional regulator [Sinirhodobacter hankyongi]